MQRAELRVVAPLCLFGGAYGIAQTALLPALPAIERDLGTSAVGATSIVSVFFVAGAITSGVFGRLGDMFGKRRLIIVQLGTATAGLVVCALAPNLPTMIAGRAIMGSVAGIFPLAFSIARDELPSARVPAAVASISALGAGGAAAGQLLGGVVTDRLGYRWIFWLGAIVFALTAVVVRLALRDSSSRTGGRVDVVGAFLLAAAIGGPLVAISESSTWGWGDGRTLLLLAGGLAVLLVFVLHERRTGDPLLSLPTLLLPQVRTTNVVSFLVGFGMFGSSAVVSQFVQMPRSSGYGFGADATHAALFLAPGAAVMLVASPVTGWLTRRSGARTTLLLGLVFGCGALAAMALANGRPLLVYLWIMLLYLGIACAFGALPLLILDVVPPNLRGQSTGVNRILRTTGSAVGLQLAAALVASSEGSGRLPTEHGFAAAFGVEAVGIAAALVLAGFLPRVRVREGEQAEPLLAAGGS